MANEENLNPIRSEKQARELGRKGGIASGEARRAKRDLKAALDILLEKEYTDKKGSTKSGAELLAFKQFEKALQGDTRAFEVVRDTCGQKPVERVETVEISEETYRRVAEALDDC